LAIEAGATFQREFTVTNPDGTAFPLAGYTVRGKLRTLAGVEAATFAATATDNKLLIELTAAQTALLTASAAYSHKYDVEAESPTGIVYRIAQGQALISAEQTR